MKKAPNFGLVEHRELDEGWVPQIGRVLTRGVVGCWIFEFRCLGFDLLRSFRGFGVDMMSCGVEIWAFGVVFSFGVWVGG